MYRYDGTGEEPESLVYPETPGAAQTITVPTFPGELVIISVSMTPLSYADHYPSLSQLLPLPLDCQQHKSVPPSESAGLHPHPPPMATGYTIKQRVTWGLLSLWSSLVAVQTQWTWLYRMVSRIPSVYRPSLQQSCQVLWLKFRIRTEQVSCLPFSWFILCHGTNKFLCWRIREVVNFSSIPHRQGPEQLYCSWFYLNLYCPMTLYGGMVFCKAIHIY